LSVAKWRFYSSELTYNWIHKVNLLAQDARYRHDGIGIFARNLFGGEALDGIAGIWAAVEEWRHGPRSLQCRLERN